MNSTIQRTVLPDGHELVRIELRNERNRWVGNIIVEASNSGAYHWLRLYSITDFGNVSRAWYHIGQTRWQDFLMECCTRDQDYMLGKLFDTCDTHAFSTTNTRQRFIQYIDEDEDHDADTKQFMLEQLHDCDTPDEFIQWCDQFDVCDGTEYFQYGPSRRAIGYQEHVLPLIAEALGYKENQ